MAHSGKTMTFATDLVPQEDNIYSLGTDNLRWRIYGNIQPIASQLYPAYTCSANDANKGVLFFGKINITDYDPWQTPWSIHYRMYITTSNANMQGWYDCHFSIQGSTVTWYNYNNFYSTSYRPIYHHRLLYPKSGYSQYGGYFGVRVQSANEVTTTARIYKIEVLETQNCTIELLPAIKRFDEIYITTNNIAASTIWNSTDYNGTDVGLQEQGDANSNTYDRTYMNNNKKARVAIAAGSICVGDSNGYAGIDNGVEFDIAYPILYQPTAIAANGQRSDFYLYYPSITSTVNTTGLTHVANGILYMTGTLSGTTFTCNSKTLTYTVPTTEDDIIYIPVAINTNATTQSLYFLGGIAHLFWYKDGAFREYNGRSITSITRSGTTFTATRDDGSIFTFTQQDNNTTYSAATNGGLSLSGTAFSIASGGVTNTMLAGSIANGKLANSKVTIAGNDVSLGGSLTASTLTESLGLSKALRFIGVTTTDMTGGTATNHSWTGTPAGISNYTPKQGDVVINSTKQDEWVCTSVSGTTYTWERLGSDTSYKIVQSPVTSATAETSTATTFVYSVTQDGNGVITVKTRPLPTYNNYSHPTGDGNLHVPATGTSNNGKVLKAGSTAGSISWGTLSASDVGAAPSSTVSCTTANVKSALGTGSDTTKFLNNKGEWAVPSYTTSLAWSAITSKPNLSTGNARIFYGTSSTAAGTAAKVVTCSIYDAYTAGDILVVKFDNANTAGSPTLNVNSKGAKNIRKIYNGAVNTLNANSEITGTCMFVYDGTQWLLTNTDYNNTYTIPTSFTITANATDGLWDLTGTNGTNAVTYALAPYSSKGTTATFYTAATNPTLTTRLNYDGYLYATKLYSGGTEVSVSGHTHSYLSSISWSGDTNLKLKQSVNGAAATDVLQFAAGSNITLTGASGKLTIAGTPDTKNTAGSTNSDSKLYLIGATSQAANPQTYSDAHVFETNGAFSAKTLGVNADTDNNKVTLQWNATDSSLDFVFA